LSLSAASDSLFGIRAIWSTVDLTGLNSIPKSAKLYPGTEVRRCDVRAGLLHRDERRSQLSIGTATDFFDLLPRRLGLLQTPEFEYTAGIFPGVNRAIARAVTQKPVERVFRRRDSDRSRVHFLNGTELFD